MALGYAVVAIVAAAIAVFALQNTDSTRVRFLLWSVEAVPVGALVLVSLAAGMVVVGLPLWLQRWRLRARCRELEARVAELERTAAEAAAPPAAPPVPRPRAAGE